MIPFTHNQKVYHIHILDSECHYPSIMFSTPLQHLHFFLWFCTTSPSVLLHCRMYLGLWGNAHSCSTDDQSSRHVLNTAWSTSCFRPNLKGQRLKVFSRKIRILLGGFRKMAKCQKRRRKMPNFKGDVNALFDKGLGGEGGRRWGHPWYQKGGH